MRKTACGGMSMPDSHGNSETFVEKVRRLQDQIISAEAQFVALVENNQDRCSPSTIAHARWIKGQAAH